MEQELKPCPFCGGESDGVVRVPFIGVERVPFIGVEGYEVTCSRCCAQTGYYTTKEEAIEAWNARV